LKSFAIYVGSYGLIDQFHQELNKFSPHFSNVLSKKEAAKC
jgi:hypothetical protein